MRELTEKEVHTPYGGDLYDFSELIGEACCGCLVGAAISPFIDAPAIWVILWGGIFFAGFSALIEV